MKRIKITLILMLCAALLLAGGCAKAKLPKTEEPQEQVPTAAELEEALGENVATREVTLYYKDLSGYLVPVTCDIPWEEGIAKATLKQMISSEENDLQAARLGLLTTLPEGLTVDLDIVGGTARCDLSKECLACVDAEEENAMVCAIVGALTEFDTRNDVQIMVGGQQMNALTYGTDVSSPLSPGNLNIESVSADYDTDGAGCVQVFFESSTSGCMVPVTRRVFSKEDLDTAVLELLKGPKADCGLNTCMPEGTGLINVTENDGIVTINMSREFENVVDQADGGTAAVKALILTCSQFDGVKEVKLQVEGKEFLMDSATFAATDIVNTQAEALMASASVYME